jgi:hypothetical protein
LSILFTGLSAGIGFANLLGYMPAFRKMEPVHALAMWQSIDHYFRARMPAFGILLQVILLLTTISLYKSLSFYLVALAFLLSVAELFLIKKKNLPLNILVQATGEKLPPNFDAIRASAINTFMLRGVINIISFMLVIAAWMFTGSK